MKIIYERILWLSLPMLVWSYSTCLAQVTNPNLLIGSGADAEIKTMIVQSDNGSLLLGGSFTTFNGHIAHHLTRLKNGAFDSLFYADGGTFNGDVYSLALQADGKILAAGSFTAFHGKTIRRMIRLSPEGYPDETFNVSQNPSLPAEQAGFNATVRKVVWLADGKMLVAGDFTFSDGVAVKGLVRLNENGSYDPGFTAAIGTFPADIAVQKDGRIVVCLQGGNQILRLNADGSLDTGFIAGSGANGSIAHLGVLTDERIWVSGSFTQYDLKPLGSFVCLAQDGKLDEAFAARLNGTVNAVQAMPDGKLMLGGTFTEVNGSPRQHIVRLTATGSIDADFNMGSGTNEAVQAIALQFDSTIWIVGNFTQVNEKPFNRVAQLTGFFPGLPKPDVFAWDRIFCTGEQVILSTYYVEATYRLSNGDEGFGNEIPITKGGTYTVRVKYNNTEFSEPSDPITFTEYSIPPKPTITPSGPTTYCSGGSITLSAPEGYAGYRWSNGQGTRSITINASGSWIEKCSVKVFNAGDCESPYSDAVTVTVLQTPLVPEITLSPSDTLMASVASSSYEWKKDGKKLVAQTQRIPAQGMGVYSVRVKNTLGCFSDSAYFVLGTIRQDFSFEKGVGPNAIVHDLKVQADDKIIIVGDFTTFYGKTASRLIRLLADGSVDKDFQTHIGSAANDYIHSVDLQPDGKILLAGHFTVFNGRQVKRVIRLLPDGSFDTTFDVARNPKDEMYAGASNKVLKIQCLPDGKIMVGGCVRQFNGYPSSFMARLLPNGDVDTTFNATTLPTFVHTFGVQQDGKPLAVMQGNPQPLFRLNQNGKADNTFKPGNNGAASYFDFFLQSDGKMLIAGGFDRFYGSNHFRLARLNPDGSIDPTLHSSTTQNINMGIYSVMVRSNKKILISGAFPRYDGKPMGGYAQLNTDGSLDTTFSGGLTTSLPSTYVNKIAEQSDGKIIVFNGYSLDGVSYYRVVRLINHYLPPAKPTITASSLLSLCAGKTVTLSAPEGYAGYLWSTGASTRSIEVSSNGSYHVQIKAANTEFSAPSSSLSVTVIPLPAKPVITVSGVATVCQGDSVILSATAGYASYQWSNGAVTQSISVRATGDYTVVVRNTGSCESPVSEAARIRVLPIPAKPQISLLKPDSLLASMTGSGYLWKRNGVVLPGSEQKIPVTEVGTYSVRVQNSQGCYSEEALYSFIPIPIAPLITASGQLTFCSSDSVRLTASDGYDAYEWSTGATSRTIAVKASGLFQVRAKRAGSDYSELSQPITVSVQDLPPTPQIALIGVDTLQASPLAQVYEWRRNGQVLPFKTRQIRMIESGQYAVKAETSLPCFSQLSPEYTYIITGIEPSSSFSNLVIYPNPTESNLFIYAPALLEAVDLVLIDVTGWVIFHRKHIFLKPHMPLPIPRTLSKGLYLLQIQTSKGVSTHKIRLE